MSTNHPLAIHKARLKVGPAIYESRCGKAVDEPYASENWTRVSCLKCLLSGAKHSSVVAKLLEEVRHEKRNQRLGGGFGSHRGNWTSVG